MRRTLPGCLGQWQEWIVAYCIVARLTEHHSLQNSAKQRSLVFVHQVLLTVLHSAFSLPLTLLAMACSTVPLRFGES